MKKVRLKERFSKATEAFFENRDEEFNLEPDEITYPNQTSLSAGEEPVSDRFATLKSILKGVFFFMPGTWVLSAVSFVMTVALFFGVPNVYPIINFAFLSRISLVLAVGTFFSWFGIGDLKNPKHLLIPLSTISTGIVLGALFALITLPFPEIRRIIFDDAFPFYLLPIGLVVSVLAKNWVDSLEQKNSG